MRRFWSVEICKLNVASINEAIDRRVPRLESVCESLAKSATFLELETPISGFTSPIFYKVLLLHLEVS